MVGKGVWPKEVNEQSRVWRQTAVTSEPAVTGIILSDGVVGFGGPLQAIVSAVGSSWGCTGCYSCFPNRFHLSYLLTPS